ncbi:MAG: cation acetate symporter [Bacteroidales bacterium]
MIYEVSPIAILIFFAFVALVLGLSFYFAGKTKSASNYFAAGGTIHWGVNGVAFAGDYLSAASFLGICGMIAFSGYDGFLYSIGFLAGWVVALFLVAEPLKRMGKFTFTDALDYKFNSRSIKLTAAISTLVVSIFYLIPQMVGAGDLVVPILGLPHWAGVVIVGSVVIFIVATAGMTSTTYVQFIKGGLLILFSVILTIYILNKGLDRNPSDEHHKYVSLNVSYNPSGELLVDDSSGYIITGKVQNGENIFYLLNHNGTSNWFHLVTMENELILDEMLTISTDETGNSLYNGAPKSEKRFYQVGHLSKIISDGEEVESTGRTNPFSFLTKIEDSEVVRYYKTTFDFEGKTITGWYPVITSGKDIMKPGLLYKLEGASIWEKLNFVSLMLALFLGTSALPHILIRYYTVPSARDARKSTIIAITAIGFFYILTLYMGLGAMINGVLDMESSNMSGPLLAKSFGLGLFAVISAVAFATVLGTVSGLIVASSGAIAHDLMDKYFKVKMEDKEKVLAGKISAFGVGIFAIILGILLKGMNVSFLVGLAFAVAASANLPAILMILFWDKTTSNGVSSSIIVGILSSVILILFSPSMFERYGLPPESAWFPMDNPGIVSIPLSFMTLILISLYSQKNSIGTINRNKALLK